MGDPSGQRVQPLARHAHMGADTAGGEQGVPQPGQLGIARPGALAVPVQAQSAAVEGFGHGVDGGGGVGGDGHVPFARLVLDERHDGQQDLGRERFALLVPGQQPQAAPLGAKCGHAGPGLPAYAAAQGGQRLCQVPVSRRPAEHRYLRVPQGGAAETGAAGGVGGIGRPHAGDDLPPPYPAGRDAGLLAPKKGALQLALPGPAKGQALPVEEAQVGHVLHLLHEQGDRQGPVFRQPGRRGGAGGVVLQYLGPGGAGAAAGRLGQHPGALAAAVADAYRAFGAQGAAEQEQHLCRQLFPNGAPEDPTVGKGGGPRKGAGGQAGAQPHPVAHHPAGPDPGPLQQDRVPAGCGPFAQHRAFVEDGSGMDTGILAQNGAVKCGAVARRCAVEHAALDQRALAHGASRAQRYVRADEGAGAYGHVGAEIAGGHQFHIGRQRTGRPDAGRHPGRAQVQLHLA